MYNADTGIVTLLGNVTITRGQNAIRGQYAVVDLNNNVSRMMTDPGKPPVEGLFVRQDQAGAPAGHDPNATPGANATPAAGGAQKP